MVTVVNFMLGILLQLKKCIHKSLMVKYGFSINNYVLSDGVQIINSFILGWTHKGDNSVSCTPGYIFLESRELLIIRKSIRKWQAQIKRCTEDRKRNSQMANKSEKMFKHTSNKGMKHETRHHFQLSNLVWGEVKIRCVEQGTLAPNWHSLSSLPHSHSITSICFHLQLPVWLVTPMAKLITSVLPNPSEHLIKHLRSTEEPRRCGPETYFSWLP